MAERDRPMPDETDLPLLNAVWSAAERPHAAFYTPGHKRGQGIAPALRDRFGSAIFQADLPELPDLDNLFAPESVIHEAQCLAAQTFGATETWFLANGSTSGIQAAMLATVGEGDRIIVPRNAHRCVIAGLILSGAMPIFVSPQLDDTWQLPTGIDPQAIAHCLATHTPKAILLVSPTYHGLCSDVEAIAALAHQQEIPLLIDEAHGAHFAFHPDLPTPAIASGADLAVQSIHKTLGALTQAAMLHLGNTDRLCRDRLRASLSLTQSSSPSYLLLASLDAARQQMAIDGHRLMTQTLELADWATDAIARIPGLQVLTDGLTGVHQRDRTRLTIDVRKLGLTGFHADEILYNWGITAELPSLHHLTFIISLGNTRDDIQHLIDGLQALAEQPRSHLPPIANLVLPTASHPVLTPRQAFFSPRRSVPIADAIGQPSAELICPYPPGIPLVLPGEPITEDAIAYLQRIQSLGGIITGNADPTLQQLSIVERS
jgi:arginine decarboxylase